MVISFLTPQMTTWLLGKLKVVNTCKCIHQICVDELSTRLEFSSNGFYLIYRIMYLSIFKMKTAKEKTLMLNQNANSKVPYLEPLQLLKLLPL